jgi:hypothetical protein
VQGFSVREFGARGDGITLDTAAIQAAIDACATAGGGLVTFSAGRYVSGTVFLRTGVTLRLEANAVLIGTTDTVLYYSCDFADYPIEFSGSLVYAEDATGIGICGPGVIDGQGRSFPHGAENFNAEAMSKADTATSYSRPVLVRFERCERVRLDGITLSNAASMAVHCEQCRDIHVSGITIDNRVNQNADGINFIGCEDVVVSNCNLSCGDDAIAIYKSAFRFAITNCIISSRWAALRIGPFSRGIFRDITVNNCLIHDTFGAAIKLQMVEGGVMENISFSNIVMQNVTGPISLRLAGWLGWRRERSSSFPLGILRNVSFRGIRATVAADACPLPHEGPRNPGEARSCITITGQPGHPVTGISFSDVHVTFPGGGTRQEAARDDIPEMPDAYPEYHMFGVLPAFGMYARHVHDLALRGVRFDLAAPDMRPAIFCDDTNVLELSGFRGQCDATAPMLRLRDGQEVFISTCWPVGPIGTFLRLEGERCGGVVMEGNNLRDASVQVELADGAPAAAVEAQ